MPMLKLLELLLRETLGSPGATARTPEPTNEMDDPQQVEAFHQSGAQALLPVYHFNALATSRLTPVGGTVVDLGSGSARYLAYLAQRRPDLRIIGLELAPTMIATASRYLRELGLSDRVQIRQGDMTRFADQFAGESVATVSSVFSLHHLPTLEMARACLAEVQALRERQGCAVWVFDFSRPKSAKTARLFPAIFTPDAPAVFNEDTRNSLLAAFTVDQLTALMDDVQLRGGEHALSRGIRLYQTHSFPGRSPSGNATAWQEGSLDPSSRSNWRKLQSLFPTFPLTP